MSCDILVGIAAGLLVMSLFDTITFPPDILIYRFRTAKQTIHIFKDQTVLHRMYYDSSSDPEQQAYYRAIVTIIPPEPHYQ